MNEQIQVKPSLALQDVGSFTNLKYIFFLYMHVLLKGELHLRKCLDFFRPFQKIAMVNLKGKVGSRVAFPGLDNVA